MGWRELQAWLAAAHTQNEGPQDDPHSWKHANQLREMQAARERRRQEGTWG